MSSILGVLDLANIGAPIRISFTLTETDAGHSAADGNHRVSGALTPASTLPSDILSDSDTRESLDWAHHYTAIALGWPKQHNVVWNRASIDGQDLPLPEGGSLFGAFCLGLMQLMAVQKVEEVRGWSDGVIAGIRSTALDRVAVSADFDPDHGGFKGVGAIESKLAALGQLGPNVCSVCVVAEKQGFTDEPTPVDIKTGYFQFTTSLGRQIPLVKAIDPIDALQKLFKLQANGLARHFLQ